MAVTRGVHTLGAGQVSSAVEVEALCRGAAVLSRGENRIAARALLWAAVAIDPQSFVAHRRLAAALLNGEDVDAAAEEYARFIELLLKEDDVRRAASELAYARSFLGDMPQLRAAADHLVPLGEIARSLDSSAPGQSSRPMALAEYAARRAAPPDANNWGRSAPPAVVETATAQSPWDHLRRRYRRWESETGIAEYVLVIGLVAAAAIAIFAMGGLR
jgi:hypothetical protein